MPDHLHNMGSMALGVGTSAVGSPGFGQNPAALGHGASHHYTPQLGGGLPARLPAHTGGLPPELLAHTAAAAPWGSHGAYHPFGSAGGISAGPQSQSSGLNTGV